MSTYQRYLSKSLIFFSSIFVIFLLFIESNIGFKSIFNLTSQYFLGFKTEEILGNWRDFTLKNINYHTSKVVVQADSVHIILDIQSLFKTSTIFKKIDTKNLIISLKKEKISSNSIIRKISFNTNEKNIFIKYPIIFQKIHADKILLKMPKINISLSNVFSSIKLINNNITFFPTYINTIHIVSSHIPLKKNLKKNHLSTINSMYNTKKINNFLYFLSTQSKIFIPFNINFTFLKCRHINLIDNKKTNLFTVELRAKVENNILTIKKIKIYSTFLSMKSYGQIIFSHNAVIFNIQNKILIPNFHNKIINFLFKAHLNNKFIFQLIFNNLYKMNIYGTVLLDDLNHPFYIHLKSNNLFFSIKKKLTLEIKHFKVMIKGKLNNYFLSLKQVLSVHGMPSIFIHIKGNGNLKNVFLKKIKFFLLKNKIFHKKKIHLKNHILYMPSILKLIGKINVIGESRNNTYNLCIPKIHIDGHIMKKKLSISGSLSYRNFDILESSGINLFLGKNNLHLKGVFAKKFNVYSSISANNLDYFLPNLKGKIKARSHLYGNYIFPSITNKILANNIHWKDVYFKSIKILANMNIKRKFSGNFSFYMKKAQFSHLHFNSLNIRVHWNDKNQKFYFLLKSPMLYINIILNSIIDHKTGHWHGFFKKINIQTIWGKFITKQVPFFYYYSSNSIINNFCTKKIKIRNFLSSFLDKTNKFLFYKPFVNFKSELFIQTKFKWILGNYLSDVQILLKGDHIRFERKNKKIISFEDIDYLNLSLNLMNNNFISKWIIKKSVTSLENQNILGELNILDIYNQKKIEGACIISNFPISFINFFTESFKQVKGTFNSNIKFLGSIYRPEVLANVSLKNIFIKSDNLLKYITLFFPSFVGKIDNIKINQEIIIKKSNLLFTFNGFSSKLNSIEWGLSFNSKRIAIVILPGIKVKFSSQLKLHYLFEKYDLIGYIKFSLFYFKINEKNFII